MTMNKHEKMTMTGALGERLVAKYYRDQGHVVEESLNMYDSEQDMHIDGANCEVKTQQPWHNEKSFTIRETQLKKCLEADKLVFVETPSTYNNYTVQLWEFPKESRTYRTKTTRQNRTMHLFEKKNGVLLQTIDEKGIIDQFKKFTLSQSIHGVKRKKT